jgi:hypothetical protein
LEGYKTLHITYAFSTPLEGVYFSWCHEIGTRVYGFFELPADGNTQAFTIKSRYLRVEIKDILGYEPNIDIILYATK